MRFRTTIRQGDKTATGIEIPDDVVATLGAGKKPPVRLRVNGYEYRSTVATIDGRFMVGLSAEHRAASGLSGGDEVEVEIEVDTAPRTVDVPADLQAALDADAQARQTFDRLSNSMKGYHVSQVLSAKTDETRQRRIDKSVALLHEGQAPLNVELVAPLQPVDHEVVDLSRSRQSDLVRD